MDSKVDYLSFTLPLNLMGQGHSDGCEMGIVAQLELFNLKGLLSVLSSSIPERRGGRKLYGAGLFWKTEGVNIWFGGHANHVLLEISGVGCQVLRDAETLEATLLGIVDRVTRLDIATDFETDVSPAEFVAHKAENRLRVTETHDTDTGETQYVGSKASERFTRVYKFRSPHPRSGVMRVETVLRSDYAKAGLAVLLADSLVSLVDSLGVTFGWTHALWTPEHSTADKLRASRADKEDAATLRWIYKSVKPALLKAHASGLLDLPEFCDALTALIAVTE